MRRDRVDEHRLGPDDHVDVAVGRPAGGVDRELAGGGAHDATDALAANDLSAGR